MLDDNGKYYYQNPDFPQQYLNVSQDHLGAFEVYKVFYNKYLLQSAGLDVTAIAPPNIKDQPFTGKYAIDADKVVDNNKWTVGNREVADFILKEI